MVQPARRPTATSTFGVGRREAHDASAFYARFTPPEMSDDDTVLAPAEVDAAIGDPVKHADARHMAEVPDGSVALVVTSPPYFAGKAYEAELGADGVPASYAEYLGLLTDVFAEAKRTLEPGGRIAVNVANLGRRPYRSLSADVIAILQDTLGLLLRGEVIWRKAEGATGSCAWGSYLQPTNPTIRDLTERVIVASKGRLDRARSPKERERDGLPHRATIDADLYMENTLDVWDIPPAHASTVGHPAPFPVELPERLIQTYTWEGDLVLDPFMGSGSALVAAVRTGRRYVGYDTDPNYVALTRRRVAEAQWERPPPAPVTPRRSPAGEDAADLDAGAGLHPQARATVQGRAAKVLAEQVLTGCGFEIAGRKKRLRGLGVQVDFHLLDGQGGQWYVDVSGAAFGNPRGGLRRTDTLFKALGRAAAIGSAGQHRHVRLLLLSSHLPEPRSEGDRALRAVGPRTVFDVIQMADPSDQERLARYAAGGFARTDEPEAPTAPELGFWRAQDLRDAGMT